jgi:hypothetical protein
VTGSSTTGSLSTRLTLDEAHSLLGAQTRSCVQPDAPISDLQAKPSLRTPQALLPPPAADDRPVPAKQRAWRDEPQRVQRPRQVTRSGSEERAISRLERGPGNLPAQDIELVTEDISSRSFKSGPHRLPTSKPSRARQRDRRRRRTCRRYSHARPRGHDRGNGTLQGSVGAAPASAQAAVCAARSAGAVSAATRLARAWPPLERFGVVRRRRSERRPVLELGLAEEEAALAAAERSPVSALLDARFEPAW